MNERNRFFSSFDDNVDIHEIFERLKRKNKTKKKKKLKKKSEEFFLIFSFLEFDNFFLTEAKLFLKLFNYCELTNFIFISSLSIHQI